MRRLLETGLFTCKPSCRPCRVGATFGGLPRSSPASRMHVCSAGAAAQQISSRVGEAALNACLRRGYDRTDHLKDCLYQHYLGSQPCSCSAIPHQLAKSIAAISLDQPEAPKYLAAAKYTFDHETANCLQRHMPGTHTHRARLHYWSRGNALRCTHSLSFRRASGTLTSSCPRSLV